MTGQPACPLPGLVDLAVSIDRWEYRTPYPAEPACCRLQVFTATADLVSGGHVAVVTEIPDNPGMSVTNAAEYILSWLHAAYPGPLVVMEHYCGDPAAGRSSWTRRERLDRVWLTAGRAGWQPVWPVGLSHPDYEAHSLWARVYFKQATGCLPDLPALT
jgi:hypothetical protein